MSDWPTVYIPDAPNPADDEEFAERMKRLDDKIDYEDYDDD